MISKSQVQNSINLVDYQEGPIVSKTLIDKKVGAVTLFAFDKDQSLSKHTASYDALANILDGDVEITILGDSFKLKKDEIIIMPVNKPHAVYALIPMKMILPMIRW